MITQKKLAKLFMTFLTNYESDSSYTQEEFDKYLQSMNWPKLSEVDQQHLNSPFTEAEVWAKVNSMATNKSSFSAEFYEEFWIDLQYIFMPMINPFCHNKILPNSKNYAHISVLHKSGKDPLNCSSYSLLDHDYKIIMKLLA